ncbi:hypothetical protein [Nocardia sp. IFM 10818]
MAPELWADELREIARSSADTVVVLNEMIGRHEEFGSASLRATRALREAFGLSIYQCHYVIGWAQGSVSDARLREIIPNLVIQ